MYEHLRTYRMRTQVYRHTSRNECQSLSKVARQSRCPREAQSAHIARSPAAVGEQATLLLPCSSDRRGAFSMALAWIGKGGTQACLQQLLLFLLVGDRTALAAVEPARALLAGSTFALWRGFSSVWNDDARGDASNYSNVYRAMLEAHEQSGLPNNTLMAHVLLHLLQEKEEREDSESEAGSPLLTHEDLLSIQDDASAAGCGESCSSHPAADENGCYWWAHSYPRRQDVSCHGSRSLRMHRSLIAAAEQKALRCFLTHADTECVLTHEVGLMIPGFFHLNRDTLSVQLWLYPSRLLDADAEELWAELVNNTEGAFGSDGASGYDLQSNRTVRVLTQGSECTKSRYACPSTTREYARIVPVEYTDATGGAFNIRRSLLRGNDAFCLQLLEDSLPVGCSQ